MKKHEVERWFDERREKLGDDKTTQIAVWFASRCAMRVAPVVFSKKIKKDKKSFTIAVLWSTTASLVASNRLTHDNAAAYAAAAVAAARAAAVADAVAAVDVVAAADAAAVVAAATVADAVADAVAVAAAVAAAAADADAVADAVAVAVAVAARAAAAVYIFDAAKEDLKWLEQNDYQIAESSPPLWHDVRNPFKGIWEKGRNDWQEAPSNPYAFFIDHYDRLLRGDVSDWPILEALASKEAVEVWQTESIHQIADYIQKLKLDLLRQKTAIGTKLQINPTSGLIEEVEQIASDDLMIDQARYELSEAKALLEALGGNLRPSFTVIADKITRALAKDHARAGNLTAAAAKSRELLHSICHDLRIDDPREQPILGVTLSHLESAVAHLISHPEVKQLAQTRLNPDDLTTGEIAPIFNEAVEKLIAASEQSLAEDLKADMETLTLDDQPDHESGKDEAGIITVGRLVMAAKIVGGAVIGGAIVAVGAANTLQQFMASPWGQKLIELFYALF